jgi:RNA polymerase sigma-70 factor (ECF subfamily)
MLEGCRRYLLRVARRRLDPEVRGKVDATDVVQETFLEAQRDFARFHGNTEQELLAWLRRILLNNLANVTRRFRRTRKRQIAREVPLSAVSPDELRQPPAGVNLPDAAAREETAQTLDRALERLPEHYRQAILLRHREQLPFGEIGKRLGRSADAARKLLGRAAEQLADMLEAANGDR